MFQLRIYTLRSAEALDRYAAVHWARHIDSLELFGVATRGIWTSRDGGENRLFAADMAGFDPHDIVDVASVLLDSTVSSPIR